MMTVNRTIGFLLLFFVALPVSAETWFVRPDGGTRYSAKVHSGQCDGRADVRYPGRGVDRHCAFNDVRYLWSDNSGAPDKWAIAGGDTVVVRGCKALSIQGHPSNPDCRLGFDTGVGANTVGDYWCPYGTPNPSCFNPPIPSGTAEHPTKILGGCAYGSYTCTPIKNNYPYGKTNETQLFGGFGQQYALDLRGSTHVEIEGIELTTHNGVCTVAGTPSYPRYCSTGQPYDDYAVNGIWTDNSTSNITLQDVYIHGFNLAGLYGPIGGPIAMTRVFVGFNAFAGWMFDDGRATPDAPGSSITANYVTMIFNGCYEQYPITAKYPARVCYDSESQGFGDSWSGQGSGSGGQNSELSSFTCNHCVDDYNTKDGFIGPHIEIPHLTIIHSVAIGNMGSNWKWGGTGAVPNNTTFQNNLTVNNCTRMKFPMNGVPSTYNRYLSNFCRAGGSGMASVIPVGSTWNIQDNTFISADQIALYVACPGTDRRCPSTINVTNNVFLGYTDPNNPDGDSMPTLYYFSPGITLHASHNVEYGMRKGTCPAWANGMLCGDPRLVNEPRQPWPGAESDLDVFDPFAPGNAFHPSRNSPIVRAGVPIPGLTTDYYGVARPNPPSLGAVQP